MGGDANLDLNQVSHERVIIEEFRNVYSGTCARRPAVVHDINFTSDNLARARPYGIFPRRKQIVEEDIQHMLEAGVIEPGDSDYSSPLTL